MSLTHILLFELRSSIDLSSYGMGDSSEWKLELISNRNHTLVQFVSLDTWRRTS